MEPVTETTRKTSQRTPKTVSMPSPEKVSKTKTHPDHPGVEFDEHGEPVGACTVVELFDDLDRQFVEWYGEEGRRMVNEDRAEWNKDGLWHFEML